MTTPHTPDPAELLLHARFVRGLARAALRGDAQVDDAVQETWLAALGDRAPDDAFAQRPWLARVVRNVSYTLLRRDTRRERREIRVARTDHAPSAAEITAREETRRHLVDALLAVGEPYRSTLILRYYEDLPPREVAKRQAVPVETVRTRIKRGLLKLREALDASYGDRETWAGAMVPLLGLPGATPAASAAGMGAALKIALVVLPLALLGGLLFETWPDTSGVRPKTDEQGDLPQPVLLGRVPPPLVPNEVARCTLRGRVQHGDRPLQTIVEIRRLDAADAGMPWYASFASTAALHRLDTQPDGTFEVTGLAEGATYEVRASITAATWVYARTTFMANGQVARVRLRAPTGPRTIEGRAVYADGRAFRGAILCRSDVQFGTHTGPRGHFRLDGVPAGALALSAYASGTFSVTHRWPEPTDETWQPFVVDRGLSPASGRVIGDTDGRGVAGAAVRGVYTTHDDSGSVSLSTRTRTDAAGRYTLPVLPGMRLSASAPRFAAWHPAEADGDGLCRLAPAAQIEGTVRRADGSAVGPGTLVSAVTLGARPLDGYRTISAATDARGRYRIDAVPGRILLYAHGPAWASRDLGAHQRGRALDGVFVLGAGERTERDLTVQRTAVARGRVLDEQGQPLAGALVSLTHVNAPPKHKAIGVLRQHVATREDGSFVCPGVAAGLQARLRVSYPGYATEESARFALDPGTGAEFRFPLRATRRAVIRVVDADTQTPVAGAEVAVFPKHARGWGYALTGPRGTTDERGIVTLEDVPQGHLGVRAYASGFVRDDNPKPIEGTSTSGPIEATVSVQPAMVIQGVVHVPEGLPLERVSLVLEPEPGTRTSWSPARATPAAPDGRFAFAGQQPGPYVLRASARWQQRRYTAEVSIDEDAGDLSVDLREGSRPGAWLVRVQDESGTPIDGAHVIRFLSLQRGPTADASWTEGGLAVFDPSWRQARAWLLVEGHVDPKTGEARHGGVLVGPVKHTNVGFDVVLPRARTVKGVVRWPDGKPAQGLEIRAFVDEAELAGADYTRLCRRVVRTNAEGVFTLRGLGELPYRLAFEQRSGGARHADVPIAASDTNVAITLSAPPQSLSLKVRTPGGRPAAGAPVWVFPARGPLESIATTQVLPDGSAQLLGIDEMKSYRLRIGAVDGAAGFSGPWDPAQRDITLPKRMTIRGEVRAPDGRVIERVQLWRRSALGEWLLAVEKPRRTFEIVVGPGNHRVVATPVGEQPSAATEEGTELAAGSTHAVVPFDPGASLRFAFTNWPSPPGSFSVRAEGGDNAKVLHGWMNAEGMSELPRLDPDATYTLFASPDHAHDPTEHGVYVLLTGLRPDGRLQEVRLERAEPAHGTVVLPEGSAVRAVRIVVEVHGIPVHGRVARDGSFRVPGLPPGSWPLVATLEQDGRTLRMETTTQGAAAMEIRLED